MQSTLPISLLFSVPVLPPGFLADRFDATESVNNSSVQISAMPRDRAIANGSGVSEEIHNSYETRQSQREDPVNSAVPERTRRTDLSREASAFGVSSFEKGFKYSCKCFFSYFYFYVASRSVCILRPCPWARRYREEVCFS